MIIYIYSYKNLINGHRYIGKTNNIERRKREHISNAYNSKSLRYNSLWSKKIREYGIENFQFEILETANEENWKEREKYWIKHYNTFDGVGYNLSEGGDGETNTNNALTPEESIELIEMLKNSELSQERIAEYFNISKTLVSNINTGLRYRQDNINYPIRQNYKIQNTYLNDIIKDLQETTLTFKEIANKYNVSEASIKKINTGNLNKTDIDYPIRKISAYDQKSNVIKQLLSNGATLKEIKEQVQTSDRTIKRINKGETHFDPKIEYPINKNI